MAEERKRPSCLAYFLYYLLLFFANWFGSDRFDVDGDGDFDAEDVEAYLAGKRKPTAAPKRPPKPAARAASSRVAVAPASPAAQVIGKQSNAEGDTSTAGSHGLFDFNGDGHVDFQDMVISPTEGVAEEDIIVENLVRKKKMPWFIFGECIVVVALWGGFAFAKGPELGIDPLRMQAGLDSMAPGLTTLRIADVDCTDVRPQIWRWWTYQFTHVGALHALMNVLLNILLGVPLESLHGHLRMATMFNVGVFGGACCYFFNDAHTTVVGCSGGCYSLLGIHLADLFINWGQKKFRIPTLLFLVGIIGFDVTSYVMSMSSEQASHSAHVGGGVAGLIIGCLLGRNLQVSAAEKIFIGIVTSIGVVLMVTCLAWMIAQDTGPRNIWESLAGRSGWCWVRQVYSPDLSMTRFECVRCGLKACVERWSALPNVSVVSRKACEQQGFYYDGR